MEYSAVFSKITSFLGFSYKRHHNPDRPHESGTWCSTVTAVDMWNSKKRHGKPLHEHFQNIRNIVGGPKATTIRSSSNTSR